MCFSELVLLRIKGKLPKNLPEVNFHTNVGVVEKWSHMLTMIHRAVPNRTLFHFR